MPNPPSITFNKAKGRLYLSIFFSSDHYLVVLKSCHVFGFRWWFISYY